MDSIKPAIDLNKRFATEKNDCTVRAYSIAAEIPYVTASVEMYLAGRKFKKAWNVHKFFNEKGWMFYKKPNMTVLNYCLYVIPSGHYIVWVRHHVFAVIDGQIQDFNPTSNHNKHVLGAWRVK